MSSIVNKVKDTVTPDKHHSSTTTSGVPEGTHGPHTSRIANTADPRVDSDLDHRGVYGSNTATTGPTVGAGHGYTTSDNYTHTTGPAPTTAGPHRHDVLNRTDPRIDADRDGRYMGNTAGDVGGRGPEGVAGPHSTRIANALDPRVDSDRDASRTVGNTYGSAGTAGTPGAGYGNTGTYGGTGATNTYVSGVAEGTYGPHFSRVANAADPRVDSDRDHRAAYGTTGVVGTTGHTATRAPNTTGPHKSDLMNKIDPRVDSNLDGSKTVGGNTTYT